MILGAFTWSFLLPLLLLYKSNINEYSASFQGCPFQLDIQRTKEVITG